ncbi:DUF106 domain-containing protein [archaeon]|jgi:uncharacterized membrane protein (DUF106 family)|nr:DUF106 domain-containing protein [archaeon]
MVIAALTAIVQSYPIPSLIVISAVLTLITTLLMLYFTDQEHIRNLRKRHKELQAEIKVCNKKGDNCRLKEVNDEMVELSMKLMKASFSFKQLLITMIPFLLIFKWLKGIYIPIYGGWWIAWYLLASMISSSLYRKLFKMA